MSEYRIKWNGVQEDWEVQTIIEAGRWERVTSFPLSFQAKDWVKERKAVREEVVKLEKENTELKAKLCQMYELSKVLINDIAESDFFTARYIAETLEVLNKLKGGQG